MDLIAFNKTQNINHPDIYARVIKKIVSTNWIWKGNRETYMVTVVLGLNPIKVTTYI